MILLDFLLAGHLWPLTPSQFSLPLQDAGQEATLTKPLNPFWNQEVGLVCVCECARVCLCLQAEVMRTGCRRWPPIPLCGGGSFSVVLSRFFPKCWVQRVRESTPISHRVFWRIPNIQREHVERGSWQPIKNTARPPSSCLLTLKLRRKGLKNVSMTWLPNAPTHWGFSEA